MPQFLYDGDTIYLLCIRNGGTLELFKIAITYLNYYINLDIGKKCENRRYVKIGANLEHILNIAVFQIVSINRKEY